MASVPRPECASQPTNLAPLTQLFAYTQTLGLERWLARPKRGVSTLVLSLLWLTLAWRSSGRPYHLSLLQEPLLAALLGIERLPSAETLRRSLAYFPAQALRHAVEGAYWAELPRRAGRVWAALDAHQLPYWGRGQTARLGKGWSGSHSRALRGYRLYLAVDTHTGQIITFVLLRGNTRDHQVTAVLARRVRALLGRRLAGVVADCGFTSHTAGAALLQRASRSFWALPARRPFGSAWRRSLGRSAAGCARSARFAWASVPGTRACNCWRWPRGSPPTAAVRGSM